MKHLFVVNSGVTLLAMKSVAKELRLSHQDIIVSVGRNIALTNRLIPEQAKILSGLPLPTLRASRNPLKIFRDARMYSEQVKEVVEGDEFTAYLPHSIFYGYRLLHMHRLCSRICYIEEGALVYSRSSEWSKGVKPANVRPVMTLMQKVFFGDDGKVSLPFDSRASSFFGFFPQSFRGFSVECSLLQRDWKTESCSLNGDLAIVALPPCVQRELGIWDLDDVIFAVGNLACRLKNRFPRHQIILCPHPSTTDAEFESIQLVFNNSGVDYTVITQDVTAEQLMASNDCVVLHAGSSVGIYGCWLGKKVYFWGDCFPRRVSEIVSANWNRFKEMLETPLQEDVL